jgi:hypothetical protein
VKHKRDVDRFYEAQEVLQSRSKSGFSKETSVMSEVEAIHDV